MGKYALFKGDSRANVVVGSEAEAHFLAAGYAPKGKPKKAPAKKAAKKVAKG